MSYRKAVAIGRYSARDVARLRSARKWHDDTATEAPIVLEDLVYGWVEEENGMRTSYQLPPGVADVIEHL